MSNGIAASFLIQMLAAVIMTTDIMPVFNWLAL